MIGAILFFALSCGSKGTDDAGDTEDPGTATDTDSGLQGTGDPIVVFISLDTLGFAAAKETDWCQQVNDLLGTHGLDAACIEGGIAPASWTGESHLRTLFPPYSDPTLPVINRPECSDTSLMQWIADNTGASYVYGADNVALALRGDMLPCANELSAWSQGADQAYEVEGREMLRQDMPEEERPVHFAIDGLLEEAADGGPVIGFLNMYEVGGHFPRCWFDAYSDDCELLWNLAVDLDLVPADSDRREEWLSYLRNVYVVGVGEGFPEREAELREPFWRTMKESIEYNRGPRFEDRLEKLLAGLDDLGRTGDLVLVLFGDHGENPCVMEPFRNVMNCAHTAIPTEWTASVPVFVSPASLGEEWVAKGLVGDITRPWSTINLSHAILDHLSVPTPETWPAMEPPGAASSWSCSVFGRGAIRVVPGASLKCQNGHCGAFEWTFEPEPTWSPAVLEEIPAELQGAEEGFPDCAR